MARKLAVTTTLSSQARSRVVVMRGYAPKPHYEHWATPRPTSLRSVRCSFVSKSWRICGGIAPEPPRQRRGRFAHSLALAPLRGGRWGLLRRHVSLREMFAHVHSSSANRPSFFGTHSSDECPFRSLPLVASLHIGLRPRALRACFYGVFFNIY